jgi:hypothetical protein
MAKTKISEWSATPANNTDIDGINIAEGCAPSGINDAIREMMAQVKDLYAGTSGDATAVAGGGTGATTASAARTNLGLAIGTDVQAYNANLTAYGATGIGFRNRIINGDMRIDQRNAGAAVTASNAYAVDRFISLERSGYTTLAVTAQQQTSDVPANFSYALKLTVSTGQAVSSSGNLNVADQRIEGFNFADLGFGTANAKSFTMSFWVKSSIAGTYPVSFFNAAVNRGYLATYTINSANTWEYKTFTVAGDTSGTWNTGNGIGLGFQMAVSSGSNNFGTPGSWGGTYKSGVSGMPDLGATTGATFYITGVQLEAGSVASPFERRDYGRELMMAQRYYWRTLIAGSGNAGGGGSIPRVSFSYPQTMRAAPTLSWVSGGSYADGVATEGSVTALGTVSFTSVNYTNLEFNTTLTGGAAGRGASVWNVLMQASSEL